MPKNRRKVTGLVGWVIRRIRHTSGNFYAITIERHGRRKTISVGVDELFDEEQNTYDNNAPYEAERAGQ